jgi:hypothetical protein
VSSSQLLPTMTPSLQYAPPMDQPSKAAHLPPPLIAVAGWLVPGLGYWLIGERGRGTISGITIIVLYLLGLLIAGVRVVEVPGYDDQTGMAVRVAQNQKVLPRDSRYPSATSVLLAGGFVSEITNKPWFVGQILAGPLSLASAAVSVDLAQAGSDSGNRPQLDYPRPHAPLETVGTLYTAIAGMLNLMVIIDSTYRAGQPREPQ